jgi:hypothetical protein
VEPDDFLIASALCRANPVRVFAQGLFEGFEIPSWGSFHFAQLSGPSLCPGVGLALGGKRAGLAHTGNLDLHRPLACGGFFWRGHLGI